MKRRNFKQHNLFPPLPHNLSFFESELFSKKISLIAGVDEVGRGPLAGPVTAAAVILPPFCDIPGLFDSKQISPQKREILFDKICCAAVSFSIESVEAYEIDEINILRASLKAMEKAVEGLFAKPEYLLIDGIYPIKANIPQMPIVAGDCRSYSIAAASILAKVARDRLMSKMEDEYPGYSFSKHKGYGTALHIEEISRLGPSPIHRMTFNKVSNWKEKICIQIKASYPAGLKSSAGQCFPAKPKN